MMASAYTHMFAKTFGLTDDRMKAYHGLPVGD